MVKMFCDKCGEEVKSNIHNTRVFIDELCDGTLTDFGILQLCDSCVKTLISELEELLNGYNYKRL